MPRIDSVERLFFAPSDSVFLSPTVSEKYSDTKAESGVERTHIKETRLTARNRTKLSPDWT